MAGARWVRLDVDYFQNPKALDAGPLGRAAHLASICWVGRFVTDGVIPARAVPTILHEAGAPKTTPELLISAGLWIPNGGSTFQLHDYLEIGNPSREQIQHDRQQYLERQRRYNSKRWVRRDDDAS